MILLILYNFKFKLTISPTWWWGIGHSTVSKPLLMDHKGINIIHRQIKNHWHSV